MGAYFSYYCAGGAGLQAGVPFAVLHRQAPGGSGNSRGQPFPPCGRASAPRGDPASGFSVASPMCLATAATVAAAVSSGGRRRPIGHGSSSGAGGGASCSSAAACSPAVRAGRGSGVRHAGLAGRKLHQLMQPGHTHGAPLAHPLSARLAAGEKSSEPSVLGLGGRGIISSFSDLPKTKALGIELRASAALAAPVSVLDGSFLQEPHRIYHSQHLGDDVEANARIISSTLQQLTAYFSWSGVLGCSISRKVAVRLGFQDASPAIVEDKVNTLLANCLKRKVVYSVAMVQSIAVGYNELVYGDSASNEAWHEKGVLLCTLGKDIETVFFNNGHRVRQWEWSSETPTDGHSSEWVELNEAQAYEPPEVGSSLFDEWATSIDQRISETIRSASKIDRAIVVPTGRTARLSTETLRPLLVRTMEQAETAGCEFVLAEQHEGDVVRGAALCSLVELQTAQMMKQLEPLLNGASSLQALSDTQLRAIFDNFDRNADGEIAMGELTQGLNMMGITRDEEMLMKEFDRDNNAKVSVEEFVAWWVRHVKEARVVTITSAAAWQKVLYNTPPPGFGDLILLEVTFTFCRTCRRFEPKFQKMAEHFPEVRFVKLVGNGTVGSMELCTQELKVQVSPSFFVFRRGGELLRRWSGANLGQCTERLRACIVDAEAQGA